MACTNKFEFLGATPNSGVVLRQRMNHKNKREDVQDVLGALVALRAQQSNLVQDASRIFSRHVGNIFLEGASNTDWVVDPSNEWSQWWDVMVSMLLVTTIFTMPLCFAFESVNGDMFIINLMVDLVFNCDIIKNFNTGFVDVNGFLVSNKKQIRKHYALTWFIPDLLASFPVEAVLKLIEADSEASVFSRSAKVVKMVKLVRLTKLFRLLRASALFQHLKSAQQWLEDHMKIHIGDGALRLSKLGVTALVISHWVGCINFMICRLYDFPEESWVVHAGLLDKPIGDQYLWSLYKVTNNRK